MKKMKTVLIKIKKKKLTCRENKIINFILSLVTTCTVLLDYNKFYNSGIKAIASPIITSPIISSITIFGIFCIFEKYRKKENKTNILQKLFAIFLAIVMVVGRSYEKTNSWDMITKNFINVIVSLMSIIGYSILFNLFLNVCNNLLKKINIDDRTDEKFKNKLLILFNNKPFIISFIAILLVCGIYMCVFYPGILTRDASYQILQSLNIHTKYSDWVIQLDQNVNITNHHPVLHTLILGVLFRIGKYIVNDNFGIFLSTLFQVVVLSSVLAYTIKYLKNINVFLKIRGFILLIYCIVPMYAFYSVTIVKDTIYTALIILYIIQLYDFITNYKIKKIEIKKMVKIFIVILLIALFRNNGSHVVILSLIFAVFYSIKNIKRMATILLLFIIVNYSYINIILPFFKISDTSIREALSVPFQQTARYVKYYNNELTNEEIEVIDKVLEYKTLAKRYDEQSADPVKNKFNKYTTDEELKEYFKLWFRCLIKHPDVYIQSFLNNTYGYFYPTNNKFYLYYNKVDVLNNIDNIEYNYNNCNKLRTALKLYGKGFRNIPGIGLISNIGFNTCLVMGMVVYLLSIKEKRKYIIVLLPHLASILVCLLSPVNNYFRYAMPYIFAMPITIIFFIKAIKEKGEE